MGKIDSRTKGKRGSTDNQRRLAHFGKGSGDAVVEWSSCDSGLLLAVVDGITQLGGAVTVGLSRDGGAYSLTLLLDGDRETLWFNRNADLDVELRLVLGKLSAMS